MRVSDRNNQNLALRRREAILSPLIAGSGNMVGVICREAVRITSCSSSRLIKHISEEVVHRYKGMVGGRKQGAKKRSPLRCSRTFEADQTDHVVAYFTRVRPSLVT